MRDFFEEEEKKEHIYLFDNTDTESEGDVSNSFELE